MTKKESNGKQSTKKPNQATQLVMMAEDLGTKLFHDQTNIPFAYISEDGCNAIWPTGSRNFKRWLAQQFYKSTQNTPSQESIRQAITVMEGMACFDGEQVTLHNRVAWFKDSLYYNLSDDRGRVVKITPEGWGIVETPPTLFRRYEHQEPQVEPDQNGNIYAISTFLNLEDVRQQPLELAHLVSCFIPEVPHPIHVSYGPQGSAKSTQDRIKRRLVDPSANDVQTLTSKIEQTALTVNQNWYCAFDNVSYMNEETSDLLCRASTGGSYSKRLLYTDEETLVQKLSCCISLNGINVVISKPDLMDRCILVKYRRISTDRRKEEKDILGEFESAKPVILGGIFDILAKAIRYKPDLPNYRIPRMADFSKWGIAIAEAMGHEAETFLRLYNENIAEQNKEIINSHPVGVALLDLMDDKERWQGTPSELLSSLETRRKELGISKRSKGWPKAPNALSKKLGELETTLANLGYKLQFDRSMTTRSITIVHDDSESSYDDSHDDCTF